VKLEAADAAIRASGSFTCAAPRRDTGSEQSHQNCDGGLLARQAQTESILCPGVC